MGSIVYLDVSCWCAGYLTLCLNHCHTDDSMLKKHGWWIHQSDSVIHNTRFRPNRNNPGRVFFSPGKFIYFRPFIGVSTPFIAGSRTHFVPMAFFDLKKRCLELLTRRDVAGATGTDVVGCGVAGFGYIFFEWYLFQCRTPLKFNIAPENIPSRKESSLPNIIFQRLCPTSGGVVQISFLKLFRYLFHSQPKTTCRRDWSIRDDYLNFGNAYLSH